MAKAPVDREAKAVEVIARALYEATRMDGSSAWPQFKRHAERDDTAQAVLNHWYALAVAALDMANGARERMGQANRD